MTKRTIVFRSIYDGLEESIDLDGDSLHAVVIRTALPELLRAAAERVRAGQDVRELVGVVLEGSVAVVPRVDLVMPNGARFADVSPPAQPDALEVFVQVGAVTGIVRLRARVTSKQAN